MSFQLAQRCALFVAKFRCLKLKDLKLKDLCFYEFFKHLAADVVPGVYPDEGGTLCVVQLLLQLPNNPHRLFAAVAADERIEHKTETHFRAVGRINQLA